MSVLRPLPLQAGGRPSSSGAAGVRDRARPPLGAVQLHVNHHAGRVQERHVGPSGVAGGREGGRGGTVHCIR